MVSDRDEQAYMTPEKRLHEVASILAIGILRIRRQRAFSAKKLSETTPTGLEVPRETVLSVHRG